MSGRPVRVKICGVTRVEDAVLAAELGADMIGLNFFPGSPRCIDLAVARRIAAALPPGVEPVAVFVNEDSPHIRQTCWQTGVGVVQLHGEELAHQVFRLAPFRCIRAFRWRDASSKDEVEGYFRACREYLDEATADPVYPSAILLDAHAPNERGGTGRSWAWNEAADWRPPAPLMLAGGLRPENVAAAIAAVRPYAVDVAGGVESSPGVKDPGKLRAFVEAVRAAERISG
jgi:phosphoribosylanthranilate isomerase